MESFEKSKETLAPRIETCKQSLLCKHKVPGWEANRKPLARQTWDTSIMLPERHHLSDKLTALLEPRNVKLWNKFLNKKTHGRFCSHFQTQKLNSKLKSKT